MPIYDYECQDCLTVTQDQRTIDRRHDDLVCPKCKGLAAYKFAPPQVIVPGPLTTDFGDGSGEKTYSRHEYREKCKQLNRQPVGMLWNK